MTDQHEHQNVPAAEATASVTALRELAARPADEALDEAAVRAAFAADAEAHAWAVVQGRLTAAFATGDFVTALRLANQVGEAAEAANHHPDLEIGYGRLGVSLHSHDVNALTSRDVRLARTVSQLAAGLGLDAA